jgi:hypothetical protein
MYGMLKSLNKRVKKDNSEKEKKLTNEAQLDYVVRTVHTFQDQPYSQASISAIVVIAVVEESSSAGLIYTPMTR